MIWRDKNALAYLCERGGNIGIAEQALPPAAASFVTIYPNTVVYAVDYPQHGEGGLRRVEVRAKPGDFPESEEAADQSLALPIYPELNDEQAAYVVACVRDSVMADV